MTPLFELSQDRSLETPLDQDSARTALNELFTLAGKYNSSGAYLELMRFVDRFRFCSPFNAMLIYTQMPGAHFVCTARRWRKDFRREIKISARPIVILQPMGPVLFVFDVSDTTPLPNARTLPPQVEDPFQVRNGKCCHPRATGETRKEKHWGRRKLARDRWESLSRSFGIARRGNRKFIVAGRYDPANGN
jgi:hypothetical protein